MKVLLLIVFMTISTLSFSQVVERDSTINLRMQYAGEQLKKGSTQIIAGMVLQVAGGCLIAYGRNDTGAIALGSLVVVSGFGFTLNGIGKFGLSGIILSKK